MNTALHHGGQSFVVACAAWGCPSAAFAVQECHAVAAKVVVVVDGVVVVAVAVVVGVISGRTMTSGAGAGAVAVATSPTPCPAARLEGVATR